MVERVTSNDEVVSSILAEGIYDSHPFFLLPLPALRVSCSIVFFYYCYLTLLRLYVSKFIFIYGKQLIQGFFAQNIRIVTFVSRAGYIDLELICQILPI